MAKNAGSLAAEKYRKEIEAKFNPFLFRILAKPISLFLEKTFPEIVVKNLDYVKEAKEKGAIVYASNHKSYTDPLITGLVLYKNKINQPYYAAGRNMFHLWSAWLLKGIGAFSVDRSNRDAVYLNTLKGYITGLIEKKQDVLLYIEGGRSYDGKMKGPKLGILKAMLESKNKNVFIIPTVVNYEQVIEDKILTAIAKKTKQRRFSDEVRELWRAYSNYYPLKNGEKRYSTKAYVSFSKPLHAIDYSNGGRGLVKLAEDTMKYLFETKNKTSSEMFASATLEAMLNGNEADIRDIEVNIQKISCDGDNCLSKGLEPFLRRDVVSLNNGKVTVREPRILEYYANSLK